MPRLFSLGRYVIFFWSQDNNEPIHVHISISKISPHASKVWLTKGGGAIVANNKSKIPQTDLNALLDVISDKHTDICDEWMEFFSKESIKFYC